MYVFAEAFLSLERFTQKENLSPHVVFQCSMISHQSVVSVAIEKDINHLQVSKVINRHQLTTFET